MKKAILIFTATIVLVIIIMLLSMLLFSRCVSDNKEDVLAFPNKVNDGDIDKYIFQLSQSHADDNINLLAGWSWDCGWESEEDRESYYNNVNYHWKEIAEKEYKNWLRKQQLS